MGTRVQFPVETQVPLAMRGRYEFCRAVVEFDWATNLGIE